MSESKTGYPCPKCDHSETKVIDSRPATDWKRRRRKCQDCGHRFTTHEVHAIRGIVFEDVVRKAELYDELCSALTKAMNGYIP